MDRRWLALSIVALAFLAYYYFSAQYVSRPRLFTPVSEYSISSASCINGGRTGFADFDGDGHLESYRMSVAVSGDYANITICWNGHEYTYHTYVAGDGFWDMAVARFSGHDWLYLYFMGSNSVRIYRWSPSTGVSFVKEFSGNSPYNFGFGLLPIHTRHGDVLFTGWTHSDNISWYTRLVYSPDGTNFYDLTTFSPSLTPLAFGVDAQGSSVAVGKTSSGQIRLFYDGSWHDCTGSVVCSASRFTDIVDGYYAVESGGTWYAVIWPDTVVGPLPYVSTYSSYLYAPIDAPFASGAYFSGAYWREGFVSPVAVEFLVAYWSVGNFHTTDPFTVLNGVPVYTVCSQTSDGYDCTAYKGPTVATGFEGNLLLPPDVNQSVVALNPEKGVDHLVLEVNNISIPFASDVQYFWYLDGQQVPSEDEGNHLVAFVSSPGYHDLMLVAQTSSDTYQADWNFFVPTFPYNVSLDANQQWNGSGWDVNLSASALWYDENGPVDANELNYVLTVYNLDGNVLAEGNSPLSLSVAEQNVPSDELNVSVTVIPPDPDYNITVYRTVALSRPSATSATGGSTGTVAPSQPSSPTVAGSATVTVNGASGGFRSATVVAVLVALSLLIYLAVSHRAV